MEVLATENSGIPQRDVRRGQGGTENVAGREIMTIQQRFGRDLAWGCDQREPQLGEHQRHEQIQRKVSDLVAQRVKDQTATSHP